MRTDALQRWETEALGDSNMRILQKGEVIQLERKGYYMVDKPYLRPGKPMVLFNIPDGRQTPLRKPATADQTPAKAAANSNGIPAPPTPGQQHSAKASGTAARKTNKAAVSQAGAGDRNKAGSTAQSDVARGLPDTLASTKVCVGNTMNPAKLSRPLSASYLGSKALLPYQYVGEYEWTLANYKISDAFKSDTI